MKFKLASILSTLLITILLICLFGTTFSSYAAQSSDKLEQDQESLSDAKEEKESLEQGLQDIKDTVKELEGLKDDVEDYVTTLDGKLNKLTEQMNELTTSLAEKEAAIEQTNAALEQAQTLVNTQYESMKTRIKFMYEKGNTAYLEIILSADDFSDMLNKANYIDQLSKYDRNMLTEYQEAKKQIEELQTQLQQDKEELVTLQEEVKTNQESVEVLLDAKSEELDAYDNQISSKEDLIKDYEQELAAQDNEIKALESAVAAEKKRLEDEAKAAGQTATEVVYDGGQFAWPCPSYTRVSSDYGNRMHPTLGIEKFHNGIDLAAPSGSSILAAYGGVVVSASYNSTMGNFVMIDHGDGLFTVYMHASQLLVSTGQSVTAGQKIALVGSTGRSTGPHLHFSVRLNGSYVSPWNYL